MNKYLIIALVIAVIIGYYLMKQKATAQIVKSTPSTSGGGTIAPINTGMTVKPTVQNPPPLGVSKMLPVTTSPVRTAPIASPAIQTPPALSVSKQAISAPAVTIQPTPIAIIKAPAPDLVMPRQPSTTTVSTGAISPRITTAPVTTQPVIRKVLTMSPQPFE